MSVQAATDTDGGATRGGRPHLTRALGAVVNGPLVFVLAHDPVVDADAAVDADAVFNQLVLIRLGLERNRKLKKCLI